MQRKCHPVIICFCFTCGVIGYLVLRQRGGKCTADPYADGGIQAIRQKRWWVACVIGVDEHHVFENQLDGVDGQQIFEVLVQLVFCLNSRKKAIHGITLRREWNMLSSPRSLSCAKTYGARW